MMRPNDTPAFPIPLNGKNAGMTLRGYYAGQALAGLLMSNGNISLPDEYFANHALSIADAMLKARDK